MTKKFFLMIMIVMISVVSITVGCGKNSGLTSGANLVSTNKINPMEKGEITVVEIHKGSNVKKITDANKISTLVGNLKNVDVRRLSRDETKKVLDGGNALKNHSTILLYFVSGSKMKSMAVLLSEKQLFFPDVKSMQSNNYTVSYLNNNDEKSLDAIKTLYLQAREVMKK